MAGDLVMVDRVQIEVLQPVVMLLLVFINLGLVVIEWVVVRETGWCARHERR